MTYERRQYDRFPVLMDLIIRISGRTEFHGAAYDISLGGLSLVTQEKLAPGTRINIREKAGAFEAPAKVLYAGAVAGYDVMTKYGVAFEKLLDEGLFEDLIYDFKREAKKGP